MDKVLDFHIYLSRYFGGCFKEVADTCKILKVDTQLCSMGLFKHIVLGNSLATCSWGYRHIPYNQRVWNAWN